MMPGKNRIAYTILVGKTRKKRRRGIRVKKKPTRCH